MRNPGMGHIFLHVNRGKRSVVLDLKQPAARDALLRLAQRADAIILERPPGGDEAARPRLRRRRRAQPAHRVRHLLRLRPARAPRRRSPRTTTSSRAPPGSRGSSPAGRRTGAGVRAGGTLVDRLTALHAAYAVSAALYARERTGKGQAVEVPMFEAAAQFVLGDHLGGLTFEPPIGDAGYARLLTPHRRPYATRDGYLCLLIYNDKQWRSSSPRSASRSASSAMRASRRRPRAASTSTRCTRTSRR